MIDRVDFLTNIIILNSRNSLAVIDLDDLSESYFLIFRDLTNYLISLFTLIYPTSRTPSITRKTIRRDHADVGNVGHLRPPTSALLPLNNNTFFRHSITQLFLISAFYTLISNLILCSSERSLGSSQSHPQVHCLFDSSPHNYSNHSAADL